jgi:hypothetical protein
MSTLTQISSKNPGVVFQAKFASLFQENSLLGFLDTVK